MSQADRKLIQETIIEVRNEIMRNRIKNGNRLPDPEEKYIVSALDIAAIFLCDVNRIADSIVASCPTTTK